MIAAGEGAVKHRESGGRGARPAALYHDVARHAR